MIRATEEARFNRSVRTQSHPPRIMIVEDEDDVLEILAQALIDAGYRVLGARDGLDAMDHKARDVAGFGPLAAIDVVITDLMMPNRSGLELLQHLRDDGWQASVIVISAFADHELWSRARALGAAAMLHKPFYLGELVDLVQRLAPISPEHRSRRC